MKQRPLSTRIGLMLVIGLIQSCTPIYRAGIPNQPIMKQRGDVEISSGIETGSAFAEASYAITDFAYLTGGGLSWISNNGSTTFGEGGVGFYKTIDKSGFSFSAIGGYGESSAFNSNWVSIDGFWASESIQARYARLSLQSAYYRHSQYADFSVILRSSFVNWIAPENVNSESPGIDFYLEPTLSFRAGPPNTKFFIDAGLQIPAYQSFRHFNAPIHLGVGVDVIFKTLK